MKKLFTYVSFSLLTFLLFLITGVEPTFAACIEPNISEYNGCLARCPDIVKYTGAAADCSNKCIAGWSASQKKYSDCVQAEQNAAYQKNIAPKRSPKPQTTATQPQPQATYDASHMINDTATFVSGAIEFWKNGQAASLASGNSFNAGDIIRTGEDGAMDLTSKHGIVAIGPNTSAGFISFNSVPPKLPDAAEGNVVPRYEFNDALFWNKTATDLADFIHEVHPKYLKSCLLVMKPYQCVWDFGTFLYKGYGWFDDKMNEDFPKRAVITPSVAITPDGTQFAVEVAADGATTVTVLNGSVFVTDLTSRKTVSVGTNQQITVPKTTTGLDEKTLQQKVTTIDPAKIHKWWVKSSWLPDDVKTMVTPPVFFILLAGIIILLVNSVTRVKGK